MEKELNCYSLEKMANYIEEIKGDFLFSFDEDGMATIATQHYMASLASLEQAIRSLKIAHYHQLKGE